MPGLGERLAERTIALEWAEIAGAEAARRSRPTSLHRGILHIAVDNSPWLCELKLKSDELLARVRARHGAVIALRFSLGAAAPPAIPPAARPARARPSPLTAEEQRSVDAVASAVSDPALAATIRRLVTKDLTARRRREAVASIRRKST